MWRSTTAAVLHDTSRQASESKDAYLQSVRRSLFNLVEPLFGKRTDQTLCLQDVESIVRSAVDLAESMSRQHCRFELFVPALRHEETIEAQATSIGEREMYDYAVPDRDVARPLFVVVPALCKWGDSRGVNLDESMFVEIAAVITDGEDD